MFRKILVPLDRSMFAEQALGPATAIARAAKAEVDLVLVHEPRPLAGSPDVAWHADQVAGENEYLSAIGSQLSSLASIASTHAVLSGDIVGAICTRIRKSDVDLVAMTSHGRTGLNRAWVGSVADGVLRKSGVPVLMCRPIAPQNYTPAMSFSRILVLLDGSIRSKEILESAAALAICSGATLSLLRVVQPVKLLTIETAIPFAFPLSAEDEVATRRMAERARYELNEIARDLSDRDLASVDASVVIDHDIARAITDFAKGSGVDAIAMTTHGRGASRLLFGSVADELIRGTHLPMLVQGAGEAAKSAWSDGSFNSLGDSVLTTK
jgi:nucleotide-binding universal stress UspA family protein